MIKNFLLKVLGLITGNHHVLATSPRKFAWGDWKRALLAAKDAIAAKRIGLLAAGIAYFATFAFFPLVAASVAIASLVLSHEQVQAVVSGMQQYLPADIASLVSTQLQTAFDNQSASVAIAVVGVAVALFSISGAVVNVMSAANVSYERAESRTFVKLRLASLGLMLVGAVIGSLMIGLLLLNQPLLHAIGAPEWLALTLSIARWPVMAALISLLLAVFYRYGPDREVPKWQWVTWGSVIAGAVWLLGTAAFFVYARYFANFSDSYSVFAGVIVLMTWFNLTAFIVLLGAEINFRLESQTLAKTSK